MSPPPRYRYSGLACLYIHKRSWHSKWGPVSLGEQCHTWIFVLGGRGDKGEKYLIILLLTYLHTVIIFIIQYSDFMCFSSILAENYKAHFIYAKKTYAPLPPFGPHKHLLNSNVVSNLQNWYQLQQNESFYPLILLIHNYPHILQKRRLKTGSILAILVVQCSSFQNYEKRIALYIVLRDKSS